MHPQYGIGAAGASGAQGGLINRHLLPRRIRQPGASNRVREPPEQDYPPGRGCPRAALQRRRDRVAAHSVDNVD